MGCRLSRPPEDRVHGMSWLHAIAKQGTEACNTNEGPSPLHNAGVLGALGASPRVDGNTSPIPFRSAPATTAAAKRSPIAELIYDNEVYSVHADFPDLSGLNGSIRWWVETTDACRFVPNKISAHPPNLPRRVWLYIAVAELGENIEVAAEVRSNSGKSHRTRQDLVEGDSSSFVQLGPTSVRFSPEVAPHEKKSPGVRSTFDRYFPNLSDIRAFGHIGETCPDLAEISQVWPKSSATRSLHVRGHSSSIAPECSFTLHWLVARARLPAKAVLPRAKSANDCRNTVQRSKKNIVRNRNPRFHPKPANPFAVSRAMPGRRRPTCQQSTAKFGPKIRPGLIELGAQADEFGPHRSKTPRLGRDRLSLAEIATKVVAIGRNWLKFWNADRCTKNLAAQHRDRC